MTPGEPIVARGRESPRFQTTRWTVILTAANDAAAAHDAQRAWDRLCQGYWLPLFIFARRRGYEPGDAQDVVQDFFLHVLETRVVAQADRQRGLFRTYLLRCFCNFLANRNKHHATLKHGGHLSFVPLDALEPAELDQLTEVRNWSPECSYDFGWAYTLVGRVVEKLRAEAANRGKQQWFDELRVFLPRGGGTGADGGGNEADLYQTLRTAVHRLRTRFRDQVREEVARTVETPDEVDAELRHLRATLSLAARVGG